MKHILQFLRTVRYLRPVQIFGRLRHKICRPRPDLRPPPALRSMDSRVIFPATKNITLLSPERFVALNQESDISQPSAWNDPERSHLWLYNLHYFDDLNAESANSRKAWQRELIRRWIVENPPAIGVGWEPYPISLRIVNWIKWLLAHNEPVADMISSLAAQVRFLRKNLEYHLLGNHLLTNAKALVFAGLFYGGAEADAWLKKGLQLMERELREQILPDGGHFELSPMYHSIVLEDILDLYNLIQAYGMTAIPSNYRSLGDLWATIIGKMRRWLKVMSHPDGDIAFFNDSAFGIAATSAKLDAYASRLGLGDVSGPSRGITCLPDSGYIRLANSDAVLICDVGHIGPDYIPGHAHADSLSFELSLFGERVIVNSGISTYDTSPERQRQRSTAAHNTVEIDHTDSSEVWGSFRVARRARPRYLKYEDQDDHSLVVSCAHNGYMRLPSKVLHQRTWRLLDSRLEVTDEINGSVGHAVARFHWHPDAMWSADTHVSNTAATDFANFNVKLVCQGGSFRNLPSTYHRQFGLGEENRRLEATLENKSLETTVTWHRREESTDALGRQERKSS